jgi:hypothetical protein
MSTAAYFMSSERLARLFEMRERVQRRIEDAAPYSPDWAAASEHAEELEREIALGWTTPSLRSKSVGGESE